jgi:YXWGXW repeat-containing protein
MNMNKTLFTAPLAAIVLVSLAACTNPYDPGQRAGGGALLGAGAGALLGGAAGGGSGAVTGALAGGAIGALAGVATTPPPPPRSDYYNPPPPPERPAAMVWDPGRWQWDGRTYVWVEGHYIERPYRGAIWVPGRWEHRRGQWVWFEGRWRG